MIYVPEYNDDNCLVVYNANTIRVYDSKPQAGQTINYRVVLHLININQYLLV